MTRSNSTHPSMRTYRSSFSSSDDSDWEDISDDNDWEDISDDNNWEDISVEDQIPSPPQSNIRSNLSNRLLNSYKNARVSSSSSAKLDTNEKRLSRIIKNKQFDTLIQKGIDLGFGKVIKTSKEFHKHVEQWQDLYTLELIQKPVVLPNGTVVDSASYEAHARGQKNPITRELIPDSYNPPPSLATHNQISNFLDYVEKLLQKLSEKEKPMVKPRF